MSKSIESIVNKHATNLQNSTQYMTDGVNAVTVAPGQLAAKKADKMKANLIKSIDNGTWAARVGAVSLEDWKNKMVTVGIPRVASGIAAAHNKMVAFYNQLIPFQESLSSKIKSMPDLTLDQNIARATEYMRGMATFKMK